MRFRAVADHQDTASSAPTDVAYFKLEFTKIHVLYICFLISIF